MAQRRVTKPRARIWNIRLGRRDRELLFVAAAREEVTQSDFMRFALRERATRVLQSSDVGAEYEATATG